mmetsp:Transcript_39003/g.70255  ORF Transcript_39003/g.70255 Transcript_39003/m.70255 type:complete len:89 (-) Transcript_39003:4164-4430(-)
MTSCLMAKYLNLSKMQEVSVFQLDAHISPNGKSWDIPIAHSPILSKSDCCYALIKTCIKAFFSFQIWEWKLRNHDKAWKQSFAKHINV